MNNTSIFNRLTRLVAIAAVAFCALLVMPRAQAQYSQATVLGGTNNVSASTTNSSFTAIINVTKGVDVALQPSFKLTGSGSSAVVLKFDHSMDSVNWTAAQTSVSVTANGTTPVSKVVNVSVGAIGFLRLSSVENPNGSAVTNLTVKYAQKR